MLKNVILVMLLTISFAVYAQEQEEHPVSMESNDCVVCHSPESKNENKSSSLAYSTWENSLHAVNNVRCVTCHGDESNFRPTSSLKDCQSCHPDAVDNNKMVKTTCVSCHPAHEFFLHKTSSKGR